MKWQWLAEAAAMAAAEAPAPAPAGLITLKGAGKLAGTAMAPAASMAEPAASGVNTREKPRPPSATFLMHCESSDLEHVGP